MDDHILQPMERMTKPAKPPELRVVFDTSALFSGSASDLLAQSVKQVIIDNSGHSDLRISWFIPEIVLHERQYQMTKRGFDLLPGIQKLERLLGHNLAINEDTISSRVKQVAADQCEQLGIKVLGLDPARVDWPRIATDAAYRRLPFSTGENEKGFRDCLVGESFLQLHADSPSTPRVCRVVLVCGDAALGSMVAQRTLEASNVRVLTDPEELKGLISTLVANVTEEFVATVQGDAAKLFYEKENKDTLYYSQNIYKRVTTEFKNELSALPPGADARERAGLTLDNPRFLRKEGQRVFWVSRLTFGAKALKTTKFDPAAALVNLGLLSTQKPIFPPANEPGKSLGLFQPEALSSSTSKTRTPAEEAFESMLAGISLTPDPLTTSVSRKVVTTGKSTFEITWSVSVSTNKKLTHPRIDAIEHIETAWE